MIDTEWMSEAACKDSDPELFFPERNRSLAAINMALAVCRECPVTAECLQYSMELENGAWTVSGIWGGLSQRQRDALMRSRNSDT